MFPTTTVVVLTAAVTLLGLQYPRSTDYYNPDTHLLGGVLVSASKIVSSCSLRSSTVSTLTGLHNKSLSDGGYFFGRSGCIGEMQLVSLHTIYTKRRHLLRLQRALEPFHHKPVLVHHCLQTLQIRQSLSGPVRLRLVVVQVSHTAPGHV